MTASNTILWLKLALTTTMLLLLYFRYRSAKKFPRSQTASSPLTRVILGVAVVLSFAVFHDLGKFAGGKFVHFGETFHYYLGAKYWNEVGYYDLYNAVLVADHEQGDALAGLPFYTDLKTYRKAQRETALLDVDRVKGLFSEARWDAFKHDVSFFKDWNGPRAIAICLMDHGYNASPVTTTVLGMLANVVPVTQLGSLAVLDVLVVVTMIGFVFGTFGFDAGALFAIYFFVNILSGHEYISGGLLRYDWLLYIVVAVCLLEKGRHASAAFFLTLSAMLRVFPVLLFYGAAVSIVRKVVATRSLEPKSARFIVASGVTALALFVLPAVYLGSVLQPWEGFVDKTLLHASGVHVNHLGLRAIVLFEPSHLSLERFAEAFNSEDVVRRWQDVKAIELGEKRAIVLFASLLVLGCVTAIVWRGRASEGVGVLLSLPLVYAATYISTYYYAFLCLFVLLFYRRAVALDGFVPLGLLLMLNVGSLVTDYWKPSPIVFFTLINIYLLLFMSAVLAFESYTNVFRRPLEAPLPMELPSEPSRGTGKTPRRARPQSKARRKGK
jgi:hypothetical protein